MERIEIVENVCFSYLKLLMINVLNFFILGKSHLMKRYYCTIIMVLDLLKLIWLVMIVPMSAMENKYIVTAPGWHMRYMNLWKTAVIKTAYRDVCSA